MCFISKANSQVCSSGISAENKAQELTSMSESLPSPNSKPRRGRKDSESYNSSDGDSTVNIIKIHDGDSDFFEAFGNPQSTDSCDSQKDRRVNFLENNMTSMSFGQSPPGSPESRPSTGHSRRLESREGTPGSTGSGRKSGGNMKTYFALPPNLGSMKQFSLKSTKNAETSGKGIGSLKFSIASNVFRPPFCLIQLHREKLKMRPIQGSRRLLKCYFRLCGLVTTCNEAKLAAESLMLNLSVKLAGDKNGARYSGCTTSLHWNRFTGFSTMPLQNTDHYLIYCRGSPIEYASFTPPVGADLLDAPFPSACKPTGQLFSCLSVYRIAAPRPQNILYGEDDLYELQNSSNNDPLNKPLLLKEVSAIAEVMGVTSTKLDALRYAFNLVEQSELAVQVHSNLSGESPERAPQARWSSVPDARSIKTPNRHTPDESEVRKDELQRLIAVPMFVWIHMSEDTFRFYDHADFTAEEISNEDKFIGIMRNRLLPRPDMAIAISELDAANIGTRQNNPSNKVKSVSDELKDAIAAVGHVLDEGAIKMNNARDNLEMRNSHMHTLPRSANIAIISNERANRVLHSTTEERIKQDNTDVSLFGSFDDANSVNSGISSQSRPGNELKTQLNMGGSIEFKIQSLKNNIASRQKILSLNDELCKVETKLSNQDKLGKPKAAKLSFDPFQSSVTYDPSGALAEQQKYMNASMNTADYTATKKRLVDKRLEMFDALSTAPHHKFYSEAVEPTTKTTKKIAFHKSTGIPPLRRDNSGTSLGSHSSTNNRNRKGKSVANVVKNRLGALQSVSASTTSLNSSSK